MALISAGSLAAGYRELPTGVHRQYSLIVVDVGETRLRVHVREAISDLIFAESVRTELGGESSIELTWSQAAPSRPQLSEQERLLDEAYAAHGAGDNERAAMILVDLDRQSHTVRKLALDVFIAADQPLRLVEVLGAPASIDELISLVDCHLRIGEPKLARDLLATHGDLLTLSTDVREQLEARIELQEVDN